MDPHLPGGMRPELPDSVLDAWARLESARVNLATLGKILPGTKMNPLFCVVEAQLADVARLLGDALELKP